MKAIARVNRVYKEKSGILVAEYLGIAADWKQALLFYSDTSGKSDPAETKEQALDLMLEKLEVIANMFHCFNCKVYFTADTSKKTLTHIGRWRKYSKYKEIVNAKLKVIVKRTLRQFSYPPDMKILGTETMLKQAELMAAEYNP